MMKFQRKKVAVAVGYALGAGGIAMFAAQSALAQDVRVDVTGTNIKRVEQEGALPVQVITRADMEAQGIQTAAGLVDRLSANSSIGGLTLPASEGGSKVGYSSASLRGLGDSRTLVLLNGKRIANTAYSGATVDINSIPLSAIDRVEVLTDGASAVYGTDAIAGVINFILRKDFTGFEAYAYYGDSDQGGGSQQHYNIAGGWGDLAKDKFNVYATVDYQKQDNLAASDREFSKTSYLPFAPGGRFDRTSGNSIPGNVLLPAVPGRNATTQNPTYPGCLPPFSFGTLTASTLGQCRFDFASVIDIIPPSETWNVLASAKWQITPDHQMYFDGSWAQTESTAKVSPPPISSATILSGDPVLTKPGTPFYPTALATQYGVNGQPLEVFWRGLELGPRTDDNKIQQQRYVLGLQGNVKGWDYDTFVNWSQSKATTSWLAGWATGSTLLPILNSGKVNLFGINTPEIQSLMRTALITGEVYNATGSTGEFQAKVSNDIYNLPAGPLGFALGYDYRREEYVFNSGPATTNADVPGLGGSISSVPSSSRNINAVFAEFNIPIVKNFEANVQVRFDDYQNIGNTTNWKAGLRWQPTKELLLRGSAGTGFRAPSLPELFTPAFFGATGGNYDDPLRCPKTGSPRDCNAQFTTKLGGNAALNPEKSTNYTAGVVWEPLKGFSTGLEYYYIKVKDVIGTPSEEPIFSNMVAAEALGLLVRYAPGSVGCANNTPGLPCPVNYGIQTNYTLNQITTSGLDINFAYNSPKMDCGSINFNFQGTYVYQWDQQEKGGETQHLIGTYAGGVASTVSGNGSTGAFPKWKHNWNMGYNYGPWQANLNQTFVEGYLDAGGARNVGSYSIWGLNGVYTGFKNFTLTLGVKNLFDTDPPFTRQSQSFQVGYDPAIADPTGRFWWGAIKYTFK
jgi:iron complex outermembrane receptor protein